MMKTRFGRKTLIGICLATLLMGAVATVEAHDVPEEQVVRIDARLSPEQWRFLLHVPLTAVTDASLPVDAEGRLASETPISTLQPVAVQVIRNLDLRAERSLQPQQLSVALTSDGLALTIDATYRAASGDGLSANLNAFQSERLRPVVTELHVVRADGRATALKVTGAASRVLLDPSATDVVAQFTALAATTTLGWGDDILMLLCLLAVPLAVRAAAARVGVLIAGHAAGVLLYVVAHGLLATLAPFPAVVAPSVVVIAALYMLFGSRESIVRALAAVVGLLHGTMLAGAVAGDLPRSALHPGVAVAAFFAVVLITYVWLGALIGACRGWLAGRVRSDRLVAYGVAAFAIHTGLHHMADAAIAVDGDPFATVHAVPLVTVGWVVVILAAALLMRSTPPAPIAEARS
ncbi:MAG: hypothetical protein QM736_13395 [Vicinamibacterales bacterium]